MSKQLEALVTQYWTERGWWAWLWSPLSMGFCVLARFRRWLYRRGWLRSEQFPVPIIVVGNISVGGTGKSPLVIHLVNTLKRQGWSPAIIARGYKGKAQQWPQPVTPTSDPHLVGDEPVLLAHKTAVPIMVGPSRVASVQALLAQKDGRPDIIISDDGFQHFKLGRELDIVVVDGVRRFGNGWCLPSGPLRESQRALRYSDMLVTSGDPQGDEFPMTLFISEAHQLHSDEVRTLSSFEGQTVHAVAGIGHPQRFFDALRAAGLTVIEHAFEDHHAFRSSDVQFGDQLPILMTEKDAIKCSAFADNYPLWAVPLAIQLEPTFYAALDQQLKPFLSIQSPASAL